MCSDQSNATAKQTALAGLASSQQHKKDGLKLFDARKPFTQQYHISSSVRDTVKFSQLEEATRAFLGIPTEDLPAIYGTRTNENGAQQGYVVASYSGGKSGPLFLTSREEFKVACEFVNRLGGSKQLSDEGE